MSVIDSHCHLDYLDDPAAAVNVDLAAVITVGTDPERSRQAVGFAERFPNVYAVVGVHPNDAALAADREVRTVTEELARHPRVVGVGETGFDRHWDKQTPAAQQASFEWQADLARRVDKALVLHVRDATGSDEASRAAVAAITAAGYRRGVLHCFNGHSQLLAAGLDLGWFVSFAGNLTYKNAGDLRKVAAGLPLDTLLVETDSPFLTPAPLRGKPNRPANVFLTAQVLADCVGLPLAELEPILDANARRLYGLEQPAGRSA